MLPAGVLLQVQVDPTVNIRYLSRIRTLEARLTVARLLITLFDFQRSIH